MAAPKGHPPYSGAGRPKGAVDKSTLNAREAIGRFVDGNAERLQQWLDEIHEKEGAKAAWDCFCKVIDYHVPRRQRTEHTGDGGGPVVVNFLSFDDGRELPP